MATEVNENTALKQQNQDYGAGDDDSDTEEIEGLSPEIHTPSGYEINVVQLGMLSCWICCSIIPNFAALVVGFEHRDMRCDSMTDYGLLHPRTYLQITGVVGSIVSIGGTFGLYCGLKLRPEPFEQLVNGKLCQCDTRSVIIHKIIAAVLLCASFIWCTVGWIMVSILHSNGCHGQLVGQTILAWTIVQIVLLICAVSSRLCHKETLIPNAPQVRDEEEGSIAGNEK